MSVKPILSIRDGEVAPVERVRTMSGAVRRLVELVQAEGPLERLGVVHADAPANAADVEDQLHARIPGPGDGPWRARAGGRARMVGRAWSALASSVAR